MPLASISFMTWREVKVPSSLAVACLVFIFSSISFIFALTAALPCRTLTVSISSPRTVI